MQISPALKGLSLVSFAVLLATYAVRLVRLAMTGIKEFPYIFPFEALALVSTVLNFIATILPVCIAILAVARCTASYTTQSYWGRGIVILIFAFLVTVLSTCQYLFVGQSDLVVFLQWGAYAVLLYLHKNCMDEVFAEAEYKLL